jgi:hypothetical protein
MKIPERFWDNSGLLQAFFDRFSSEASNRIFARFGACRRRFLRRQRRQALAKLNRQLFTQCVNYSAVAPSGGALADRRLQPSPD